MSALKISVLTSLSLSLLKYNIDDLISQAVHKLI